MEVLIQDIRFALRTLAKAPTFALVAVLTLVLGIGANIAIYSVVSAVLLRPLPFPHSDRLVRIFDDLPGAGGRDVGMSVPEMQDLRESGIFDQVAVIFPASTALTGGNRVERVELLGTTPNYFEMLGVSAALGRVYGQADALPGFSPGVVISDGLWKRQFGGDRNVIGRKILVDEDAYTIIGVMPPDFRHPGNTLNGDVDIWAATGFTAPPFPSPPVRGRRLLPGALARLRAGITLPEAQHRLDDLAARLQREYADDYPAQQLWSLRLVPAQASLTGNVRPTLLILLAAVGFVLLIVCVNLANLFLARASARTREYALRQALGASRSRLARQVLTESLLVSVTSGAIAVVTLWLARAPLLAFMPKDMPRVTEIGTNWRIVGLALGASVVTGLIFGIIPALHASAVSPSEQLREGGRTASSSMRHSRSRATFVVIEVAVSVVLLAAAGLQIRSFVAVLHQDSGVDPRDLVVGQVWVPVPNNPAANPYLTSSQQSALMRRVLDQLALMPGVEHTALGSAADVPVLNSVNNSLPFSLTDQAATEAGDHAAEFSTVSADYFNTVRAPIETGRGFTDHDDGSAPLVAVVNEAFVREFSPRRNPIGRHLRSARGPGFEIVGVVGDIRYAGLDVPAAPRVYASILQRPAHNLAIFVRTKADVAPTAQAITTLVHVVDPQLPVFGVRSLNDVMAASLARRRFALLLMASFGLSALLLATLGMYGVLSLLVSQRSQEFAVHLALGATPRDVLWLVFRPGLRLVGAGTLLGLVTALGVTRLMAALVYGVSDRDPVTFAGVAVLLFVVAMGASLVPARRATRVSLLDALNA